MAEATVSDMFAQIRGFRVEIDGATGKEVDTAWETVAGGSLNIEVTDTTIGADKFGTNAPGHRTVEEITLRGAMTDKRAALCQWINDTVNGKPWKRNVTITEILTSGGGPKDGKQYIYYDAFPVGYVFPRMSVTNTTGNVLEEVRIKPIRCELK